MDFLLNEKSLEAQFLDLQDFYKTLPNMLECLKVLQQLKVPLLKHTEFYQSQIISGVSVYDFANRREIVDATQRDKIRSFKRMLLTLAGQAPFWDAEEMVQDMMRQYCWGEKDVSGTSIAEAAEREGALISFCHDDFKNVILHIDSVGREWEVPSAVDKTYLTKLLYENEQMNATEFLCIKYGKGKLNFEHMDAKLGVEQLEVSELEKAMEAFERFETISWTEIQKDTYFHYKPYSPSAKSDDWFRNTKYRDKRIDKFRCGIHSMIRCFGYREKDVFYILRMERDHKISDNG